MSVSVHFYEHSNFVSFRTLFSRFPILCHVIASVADVGRTDPTFADCAAIAQVALENEWSSGTILYNFHKSAMTQEIEGVPVASVAGLEAAPGITKYDSVDADVIQNFSEFALAASLYRKF